MNIPPKVKMLLCLGIVAFAVHGMWPQRGIRHPPGVLVAAEPEQRIVPAQALPQVHGFNLTALATYSIQARVLHTKRYWGFGADLVPYDVALGWGPMSDQTVLDRLDIAQSNRFFFYQWQGAPPLSEKEIMCHAANNHLIAANPDVARAIRNLRAGQVVKLRGYLVQVTRPDGFVWMTSLTRADTGNGACEVFYVEAVELAAAI